MKWKADYSPVTVYGLRLTVHSSLLTVYGSRFTVYDIF